MVRRKNNLGSVLYNSEEIKGFSLNKWTIPEIVFLRILFITFQPASFSAGRVPLFCVYIYINTRIYLDVKQLATIIRGLSRRVLIGRERMKLSNYYDYYYRRESVRGGKGRKKKCAPEKKRGTARYV